MIIIICSAPESVTAAETVTSGEVRRTVGRSYRKSDLILNMLSTDYFKILDHKQKK